MNAVVYIDETKIGETFFKVTDESMGGITGNLIPNQNYQSYKNDIQLISDKKGIANIDDINIKIVVNEKVLTPEGGVGIIDIEEFEEIIIESSGVEQNIIEAIKNEASR